MLKYEELGHFIKFDIIDATYAHEHQLNLTSKPSTWKQTVLAYSVPLLPIDFQWLPLEL